MLLLLAGCQQKKITIDRDEATIRFQQYQDARDIDACWALIDSVEQAGIWPPEMIHYHRSIVYYNWDDPAAIEDEPRNELLGNERLLSLMSSATALTSRETIAMLKAAVEKHRAGADPNDDLTLMCLRLSK